MLTLSRPCCYRVDVNMPDLRREAARRRRRQAHHPPRRRPRAHLLRRSGHDARARTRRRHPRSRPPRRHGHDAPRRADRRLDLGRRRAAEPRLPAPRRTRPPRAADAGEPVRDPLALRRRRLREPLAVVRPRPRRGAWRRPGGDRRAAGTRRPRRAGSRPHPHIGRALRGRVLQPRARGLVRHPDAHPRPHGDRGVGRQIGRAGGTARHPSGVPVREPRRGDRRDARPPARPDLRVPLRHPAHAAAAAVDRARGRRSVRAHPRLRAGLGARHPRGRALDRVRAVRRALAARGPCDAEPARRRPCRRRRMPSATNWHRSTSGCCAASMRCTTPPRPTSPRGTRLPCTGAATRCGFASS